MSQHAHMNADASPLQHLAQAHRDGLLSKDVASLAKTLHLPVATVRGVATSYTDLHTDPAAVRICHGTSCLLAGANEVASRWSRQRACRSVHCVGYCDRSPALLLPDDRVVIQCRTDPRGTNFHTDDDINRLVTASPPAPSDVRSAAREPIVTGRLLAGGCAEIKTARAAGAYAALEAALSGPPGRVLEAVEQSGLRGRGGAGFPTGRKWRTCAEASGDRKYLIANGDEGDPGSFIDRELMERDPHTILEGMLLAAYAVGASEGIVFIRSEYPAANRIMRDAVEQAQSAGLLGPSICGKSFGFEARVVTGLGSYVCGEETAMLNAIEGKRGEARPRPPYPAECGLHGKPTIVNNVETLVCVPWIVRHGAAAYRAFGTADAPGTKAVCLNHGFARPGIVEIEFGVSLRRFIADLAGGAAPGHDLDAVLLGGPMGSIVMPDEFDTPICIDGMTRRGIRLGHGGLVALPRGTDYAMLLRNMLAFMAEESCGKCVPCSLGTRRAQELVARVGVTRESRQILDEVFHLMEQASLCGFGRETPGPVRQLIERFGAQIRKGAGQ